MRHGHALQVGDRLLLVPSTAGELAEAAVIASLTNASGLPSVILQQVRDIAALPDACQLGALHDAEADPRLLSGDARHVSVAATGCMSLAHTACCAASCDSRPTPPSLKLDMTASETI